MRDDFLFPLLDTDITITDETLTDLGKVLPPNVVKAYIEQQQVKIRDDKWWKFARDNFTNENESPWEMSPGELAIFKLIVMRQYPRSQIMSSTQYGKSITISRGLLTRVTTFPEDWLLTVPDTKRGRIIIKYMVRDTANNPFFSQKLFGERIENNLMMRLLEERSKVKLTYEIIEDDNKPRYGSAEILSADAKRKQNAITTVMGFGGRNVLSDESSLLDDEVEAGIFRMLAGKGEDTFYCKVGNPFHRNHFMRTWKDPRYKKIFVDYVIGLCEGRYLEEFISEAKERPNFSVLFGSAFPPSDIMDDAGWMPLLSEDEIRLAIQPAAHFGEERIGADVADTGENESAIVKRSSGYAEVVFAQSKVDQMDFSGQVVMETDSTRAKKAYIDKVGVGAGVYSRVQEVNRVDKNTTMKVYGVNAGEKPNDEAQFMNKRAEMYWRARQWVKAGGKLSNDPKWYQLAQIRYKANSSGKLQIMPKESMFKLGIASPDIADALSLTFFDPPTVIPVSEEDKQFMRHMRQKERKNRPPSSQRLTHMPPR